MHSHLNKEDKSKIGVYAVINDKTGETYSGSGELGKCFNRHQSGFTNGDHANSRLREAFKRTPNGWNFFPIVIDEPGLSREENREIAFDLEQKDIDSFKDDPLFLNISVDARKCRPIGIEHSEETKEKMSRTHKARLENLSDAERDKVMQINRSNLANYNEHRKKFGTSAETKQKQSKAKEKLYNSGYVSPLLGTKLSDERKQKNGDSARETWLNLTDEERKKRTEKLTTRLPGNTYTLGRKQSQEEIDRRRTSNVGKKRDEQSKSNIRAGIVEKVGIGVVIDGKTFDSYSAAASANGVSIQTVINRVNSSTEKFTNWKRSNE